MASDHEALAGRDGAGIFKTARGKVYPPGLNRALANAVADFVQQTLAGSQTQTLPSEFLDLIANDFVSDEIVQPDFYG